MGLSLLGALIALALAVEGCGPLISGVVDRRATSRAAKTMLTVCNDAKRKFAQQCYAQLPAESGSPQCDILPLQGRLKQEAEDSSERAQFENDVRQYLACFAGAFGSNVPDCQTIEPCLRVQQAFLAHDDDVEKVQAAVCYKHLGQVDEACEEAISEAEHAQQNAKEHQRYWQAYYLLH